MTEDLTEFGQIASNRKSSVASLRPRPNSTPLGPRDRTKSIGALDVSSNNHQPPSSPSSPTSSTESSDLPCSPFLASISPAIPETMPAILEGRESPLLDLPQAQSARASPAPSVSSARPVTKAPSLTVPSKISFDSVPIQWKGLPMEGALWTFSSEELQQIVSRSIRASSSESFIRLLSLELLDKVFPAELERLESAKLSTQAKYRFLLQRRMMLIQAMNSRSSANLAAKDAEDAMSTLSAFTVQLSQLVAEGDQYVEELLRINDQQAQINKMIDVHSASSLAIAVRKLNTSYGKRSNELNKARDRIQQLEAELEDAWKEAERLAQEMDEYDAVVETDDEDDAVISQAAVVAVPQSPPKERTTPQPMVPTYFTLSRSGSRLALAQTSPPADQSLKLLDSPQMVPSEITPAITREPSAMSAFAYQNPVALPIDTAPPVPSKDGAIAAIPAVIVSDTASIRSVRSNRSTKSNKSIKSSRVSSVSAAKIRSHRVSQGSLRIGHHQKKASYSQPLAAPPVPSLPSAKRSGSITKRLSSTLLSSKSFKAPKLFSTSSSSSSSPRSRHKKNGSNSTKKSNSPPSSSGTGATSYDSADPSAQDVVLDIRRPTNLEDLHITDSPTSDTANYLQVTGGVTADDIYVHRRETVGDATTLNRVSQHVSTDDLRLHGSSNDQGQRRGPKEHIPSIWLSVDAPKTPKERVDSLLSRSTSRNPYAKIKTLTKRYSLPFPLFNKSSQNQKAQHKNA
ncbi:hypothetical protein M378DRAFT_157421 [Amanita muscaria Koide BX008]|uniref:Uncharacterized protein n=1 Tax=Amanita muscaria (strain Koide BX008) TaxID=946122 RepID=A0A0C2XI82_AMAMK|nr:hypothetical protein M378DRAFT_157421 [Amanita muscaria Koide BX008]